MGKVKNCHHAWMELKRNHGDECIEITFRCRCGTIRVEDYKLENAYELDGEQGRVK